MIKTTLVATVAVLWLVWVLALLMFRRQPALRVGTAREFVMPLAALLIGLWWWFSRPGWPGSFFLSVYMKAGVVTGALLTLVWLISLVKRDAGIMDVVYSLTAAIPVLVLLFRRGSWSPHEVVTALLVGLWSVSYTHLTLPTSDLV